MRITYEIYSILRKLTNIKILILISICEVSISLFLCDLRRLVIERALNELTYYEMYVIIYINKRAGWIRTRYKVDAVSIRILIQSILFIITVLQTREILYLRLLDLSFLSLKRFSVPNKFFNLIRKRKQCRVL